MITDYESGATLNTTDYDKCWISDVAQFIAHASPQEREAIREEIESRVARYDEQFVIDGYCDRSLAVDCHIEDRWGQHYLYVWLDANGIPFYAGQSNDLTRPWVCKSSRSSEFKEKIAQGGCHSVVVAKNIHSWDINLLERDLIKYLSWEGYELVNVKDVPSKDNIELWKTLRKYTDVLEVKGKRQKDEDEILTLFREWKQCVAEIKPVISVLDKVIGRPWTGKIAAL